MSSISHDYMIKHLKRLVGKKVIAPAIDDSKDTLLDFGEPIYGLMFEDETVAWSMRDPEGNGPGFLEIQPPEKPEEPK